MVDGVSGTDLYRLVLDPTAGAARRCPTTGSPSRRPAAAGFAAQAVWQLVSSPVVAGQAAGPVAGRPAAGGHLTLETARGALALTGAVRPVHDSTLTGPLSGSRRYAWTDISLDDVRTVGRPTARP